ncbi:class I mannose-6-phosphate isomerase [Actinoplanes sp. NPDC051411]|uniref:class I mannose-6-phosphate isomerase n=1 Tax=Actinoplanes sp. NPDC051411 TaxID=3155522 RepID=UPI00341CD776
MRPVLMPPNIVDHFYRGGERIAAFRGVPAPSERSPEEWLAATVHVAGRPADGPSRLADGSLFGDLVAADPAGWTGAPDRGTDVGLLVKLLDAGQRLPVHVHPTRPFAREHLHSCYGKTEAWHILEVRGDDPSVWVGFRADVDPAELAKRVDAQDSDWLLDHMNKISVRPGDGVLVPAGEAHATGAGVFLVEVQEPTDFSILLEWSVTTAGREDSHLGLGFDTVLGAVNHRATGPEALAALRHHVDPAATSGRLQRGLPAAADAYFRFDLAAPAGAEPITVPHGFAVAVVLSGTGTLAGQAIEKGEIYAIPDGLGDWSLQGSVRVALCRPGTDWPEIS